MEYDEERATQKIEELEGIAATAIEAHWRSLGCEVDSAEVHQTAASIVSALATVTPPVVTVTFPEQTDPSIVGLIWMINEGRQGGESRKPGNLVLNLRSLFVTLSKAVLVAKTVSLAPWTAPLAALIICDAVLQGMSVPLDERDAAVMWAMWTHRDAEDRVPHATLLAMANAELRRYGRQPLAPSELLASLGRLSDLKAIEKSKDNASEWRLRERVSVRYR